MHIYVRCQAGKTLSLDVEFDSIVENLKAKIYELAQFLPYEQRLMFNGKMLDEDGRTLAYYNIHNESTLHLWMRVGGWQPPIYVKTSTWKIISVDYSPEDTVYRIKSKVEEVEGIPLHCQVLLFAGKELKDHRTLEYYEIDAGSTLHIVEHSGGVSCKSQGYRLPSLTVEGLGDLIPQQTRRARAASQTTLSKATPHSHSILETNDGEVCVEHIQSLATSSDCQAMSGLHQAKATSTLGGVVMSKLQDRPSSSVFTELEALKRELALTQWEKREADDAISNLTNKNIVISARCTAYEHQLAALEAENKKMEELLMVADRKSSEARAAGYAEGLEKFPYTEQGQTFLREFWEHGKTKWLKSIDFLDPLTDGALQFFDYGFESCQKQAEQQGFLGRLDKDAALFGAPELEEWKPWDDSTYITS